VLRRTFTKLVVSSLLFVLFGPRARSSRAASPYRFRHGVASGDPLSDRVILWTRVSGAGAEPVRVAWQVASDAGMASILRQGYVVTDASRDYTVKVDAQGLPSGGLFHFRFSVGDVVSAVGTTRTLPTGEVDLARFAVVSCSNYPTGYFHAYREIAARNDIDAVIHLGDYIYEYGAGGYGTEHAEALDRIPDPAGEALTLEDYRRRHAQYKSDPDSQSMHGRHPLIAVWDDHEIANDAWREGAENHNEGEGDWRARRDAAIQAYFEWMPIRGEAHGARSRIFRQFDYGKLLSLVMLDTRLHGRDRQPVLDPGLSDEEFERRLNQRRRQMLGPTQSRWLKNALRHAADCTWQVLGQQVLVSPVRAPDLEPLLDRQRPYMIPPEVLDRNIAMSKRNPPLLLDTWDGYAAARKTLLQTIDATCSNPVLLSGDLHTSLAGNLMMPGRSGAVAVEFMAPSVTSPGIAEYLPEHHPGAVRDATLQLNPNLAYMETDRRGWLCMTFTATECTGEWYLLDGIRSRDYVSTVDQRLSVSAGRVADGLHAA
jgi:alkaline phosphatase D